MKTQIRIRFIGSSEDESRDQRTIVSWLSSFVGPAWSIDLREKTVYDENGMLVLRNINLELPDGWREGLHINPVEIYSGSIKFLVEKRRSLEYLKESEREIHEKIIGDLCR